MNGEVFGGFLGGVFASLAIIILLAKLSGNEGEKACVWATKATHCELQWVPSINK